MKKMMLLLLACCMLAGCAGCSNTSDQKAESTTIPEPAITAEPDYSPREMTFDHISVSVKGEDKLKQRGFLITDDIYLLLEDVTLIANVPLKQTPYVDASVFNPCVDVSGIQGTGEHAVTISYKQLDPNYGRVLSVSPETITVHVEEYLTIPKVPVAVHSVGEIPEGWDVKLVCDPYLVSVSGPGNTVRELSRAGVIVSLDELEWSEGIQYTYQDIVLYNRKGEMISDPLIRFSQGGEPISCVLVSVTMTRTADSGIIITDAPSAEPLFTETDTIPTEEDQSTPDPDILTGTPAPTGTDIPPVGRFHETPDPDPDIAAAEEQLYLFIQYWNVNQLDDMLSVCSPSWVALQENPKPALFKLLRNYTPLNYQILSESRNPEDETWQYSLRCVIDRHNGKNPSPHLMTVILVKEDGQWYVNPICLESIAPESTPEPDPTETPPPESRVDADTPLYYNPDGGSKYHLDPNCLVIHSKYKPLKEYFRFSQVNNPEYAQYEPCSVCGAPLR